MDVAREIDHKDRTALEDADEDNVRAAAVVVRDEFAELGDTGFELLFTQEDVRDIVVHEFTLSIILRIVTHKRAEIMG